MSDEKETRTNGGTLINPKTQDTHFDLTKMDPSLYSEVSNLKDSAITQPILDDDPRSVYFKQVAYGVKMRMAILHELLK
jgi:peptidyl-prolyl cis-trans isomerase SurA